VEINTHCLSGAYVLSNLFSVRKLSRLQKGFDQFSFAADGHAGKSFKPAAQRHFWSGVQPIGEQAKLVGGNIAVADAVKQMFQQLWRKVLAADARHGHLP